MSVLLNIDLGELPNEPEELYALASIANIACGGHAGDEASMRRAVGAATRSGARISAHPSYPDRARFGRVRIDIDPAALRAILVEQCRLLLAAAEPAGARVEYVKPHGALYHEAARDPATAETVVDAAARALGRGVVVIGPASGALRDAAHEAGISYAREGFADRAYRIAPPSTEEEAFAAGRLVPRTDDGALLATPEACVAQAMRLVASNAVDTICVHGDAPRAVEVARAVRRALDGAS
jgi:UPF0271 protein